MSKRKNAIKAFKTGETDAIPPPKNEFAEHEKRVEECRKVLSKTNNLDYATVPIPFSIEPKNK